MAQPVAGYEVQPYYTYPADMARQPEYVQAINRSMDEIRGWYESRTGAKFKVRTLLEVKARQTYKEMRIGTLGTEEDAQDVQFMPNWYTAQVEAIGGLKPRQVAVIFAQGGGGFTTGRQFASDSGVAVVGDWFLAPTANLTKAPGISTSLATWEVRGNNPMGILAARLGQGFGLIPSTGYKFSGVVSGFQSYPSVGLLPQERLILQFSPFFGMQPGDNDAPQVDPKTEDRGYWGKPFKVIGGLFREGDQVEISYPISVGGNTRTQSTFVETKVNTPGELEFTVPESANAGFLRVWRGSQRSNLIAVNFYEKPF
jgi:hypothetical protein